MTISKTLTRMAVIAGTCIAALTVTSASAQDRTTDTSNQALSSFWALVRANGSADYRLAVDYCHSDLSDTNTGNAITVEFWSEYGGRPATKIGSDRRNGISQCSLLGAPASVDEAFTLLGAKSPVTHVVIRTNGDDAFYVDEVQLFEAGKQIMWEGRDNGGGWCVSTDPNDGGGQWTGRVAGLCVAAKRFNRK